MHVTALFFVHHYVPFVRELGTSPELKFPFVWRTKNMKQKIVINVHLNCSKCRSSAFATAARAPGVVSVALEGEEEAKMVVIGERVDAAELVGSLRDKIGNGTLESVEQVLEDQTVPTEGESEVAGESGSHEGMEATTPTPPWAENWGQLQPPKFEFYEVAYNPNPPSCTVM